MKNLGEKETWVAATRRDKFHSKLFVEGAKFVAQTETHHNSLGKLSPKSTEKYLLTVYKDSSSFGGKLTDTKQKNEWACCQAKKIDNKFFVVVVVVADKQRLPVQPKKKLSSLNWPL